MDVSAQQSVFDIFIQLYRKVLNFGIVEIALFSLFAAVV